MNVFFLFSFSFLTAFWLVNCVSGRLVLGQLPVNSSLTSKLGSTRMSKDLCEPVANCIKKLDNGKQCELLPVPKRSQLVPVPSGSYLLTQVRKGVWVYNDNGYMTLMLREGARIALVDFPDSGGSNKPDGSMTRLTDAAEEILDGTVPERIDMIYSHSHYDHIGGATRFFNYMRDTFRGAKIVIYGTTETRGTIRKSISKRAPEPTVIVGKAGKSIRLSKTLKVELRIFGGHTAKDLFVLIPKSADGPGVGMLVDVVYNRWSPFTNLAITEDVGRYREVQAKMLEFDFETFIDGHLRMGDKKDVKDSLKFTDDLIKAGATAVESVTTDDLIAGGIGDVSDPTNVAFGNSWYAFIAVARRLQIDACYRIMIEKWGCRIGGLDLTLRSNCFTAITYNIIEV